ncbi:unnamed protein product, partial [marine sediment metagenome]
MLNNSSILIFLKNDKVNLKIEQIRNSRENIINQFNTR